MSGDQHLGPGRLLQVDAGMVLLLLDDARCRALAGLTGLTALSKNESNVLTLLALGAVVKAVGPGVPTLAGPSAGDLVIGGSLLGEIGHGIAGTASRSVPGFGWLVAFALIWRYHPVARGSVRLARAAGAAERRLRTYYKLLSAGER